MKELLTGLFEHQTLSRPDARQLMDAIGKGDLNDAQIASLITTYRMRNISIDELLGFRDSLLDRKVSVDTRGYRPIDIVGTGGDGKNTFNISTCACFVVAGAGFHVAKHGNSGASSISGASNVLAHHGVCFTADNDRLMKSLEQSGVMYMHAPLFNDALKHVADVRKALGIRSFFNLLGPLVNPALPAYQLLGVYNLPMMRLYNYVYQRGETRYAVVHSLDGYDEISLTSDFKVATTDEEKLYRIDECGLPANRCEQLSGGATLDAASAIFDRVLLNQATEAQKNCVIANAAFAIRLIRPELTLETCIGMASESLESGKAARCFRKFIELNN